MWSTLVNILGIGTSLYLYFFALLTPELSIGGALLIAYAFSIVFGITFFLSFLVKELARNFYWSLALGFSILIIWQLCASILRGSFDSSIIYLVLKQIALGILFFYAGVIAEKVGKKLNKNK